MCRSTFSQNGAFLLRTGSAVFHLLLSMRVNHLSVPGRIFFLAHGPNLFLFPNQSRFFLLVKLQMRCCINQSTSSCCWSRSWTSRTLRSSSSSSTAAQQSTRRRGSGCCIFWKTDSEKWLTTTSTRNETPSSCCYHSATPVFAIQLHRWEQFSFLGRARL